MSIETVYISKEIQISDWAYLAPCGIINFQLTRLVISTPKINGLLKQKQTTWHLFHIGIRKCPIGFGIFIPNYTFCDFIWLLDNYNNAKSKDALWIINASHMHTSTIDFEYNYGPGTKTQPCKSDAINK